MRKRKIAIILCTEPSAGGGHQYAMVIMDLLTKNANQDYELVAICHTEFWKRWCRKKRIKCIDKSLPYTSKSQMILNYKVPFLAGIYNKYMTPMGKTLRKEKIDILFSAQHLFFIPNYGIKTIVPVHDLMHRYEPSFPEVSKEYDKREIILKSFAKYASIILTDSKLGKRQFEESYLRAQKRRPRLITLPFVVSEHIYNVNEEKVDVPEKYVFYPAQFWKHKNHINLLKAIKVVKEKIENVHLVLVGSEQNCKKEIEEYIFNNRLESNVTILGFVSDGNITYLYKHAVGMIMPSYFGPTNIPPLEAMSLGCPVAVSNRYAMPEQVGRAGLLFNPDSPDEIADCIERLWTDDNLREKMKREGYRRISHWNREKFSQRLLKIVNEI